MKTFEIIISGSRVHGVGFRYFVADEAEKLNITGFVRNTYDGKVEINATGNFDEINKLIKYCRTGTKMSRVESVDFQEVPYIKYVQFEIRT